jgi:hypothetical protein
MKICLHRGVLFCGDKWAHMMRLLVVSQLCLNKMEMNLIYPILPHLPEAWMQDFSMGNMRTNATRMHYCTHCYSLWNSVMYRWNEQIYIALELNLTIWTHILHCEAKHVKDRPQLTSFVQSWQLHSVLRPIKSTANIYRYKTKGGAWGRVVVKALRY